MSAPERSFAAYRRMCARERSANALNRLHIALENRMTPGQAAAVSTGLLAQRFWTTRLGFFPLRMWAEVHRKLPATLADAIGGEPRIHAQRRWALQLASMAAASGKTRPEPFARRCLLPSLTLYSAAAGASPRTLVVGFTGSSMRLMLPLPALLQHLDAAHIDFALVRYPRGRGFTQGIPGLAASFEASIDALAERLPLERYARRVTIGASGGGLAALLMATRLGFDAACSISGKGAHDERWHDGLRETPGERLRRYIDKAGRHPKVALVTGHDHPGDRSAADSIAATIQAEQFIVADGARAIGHNPLFAPMHRGKLGSLLAAAGVSGV